MALQIRRDAYGNWVVDYGSMSLSLSLHERDIARLTQKGNTIAWLKVQPDDMLFTPNSASQCLYGRMFRQIFGDKDFVVFGDTVEWDMGDSVARVVPYGVALENALLEYVCERDGLDENDDPPRTQITTVEALRVAKRVSVPR